MLFIYALIAFLFLYFLLETYKDYRDQQIVREWETYQAHIQEHNRDELACAKHYLASRQV